MLCTSVPMYSIILSVKVRINRHKAKFRQIFDLCGLPQAVVYLKYKQKLLSTEALTGYEVTKGVA